MFGKDEKACTRLGLNSGAFYGSYVYKNLWWELNGKIIGYGDIRTEDIARIMEILGLDETFIGWNEHHGSEHQQTDIPMIKILKDVVLFRGELCERAKLEKETKDA
jgi:hypothetical protein